MVSTYIFFSNVACKHFTLFLSLYSGTGTALKSHPVVNPILLLIPQFSIYLNEMNPGCKNKTIQGRITRGGGGGGRWLDPYQFYEKGGEPLHFLITYLFLAFPFHWLCS